MRNGLRGDQAPAFHAARARLVEALAAAEELERVRKQSADKKRRQDAVIALDRRGRITDEREALFDRQSLAQSQESALLSAEALLAALRERAEFLAHGEGEEADQLRRNVGKLPIAGIEVDPERAPLQSAVGWVFGIRLEE